MKPEECQIKIDELSTRLNEQIKNYNRALQIEAGYNVRKEIRNEMSRTEEEILVLRQKMNDMEGF
ncbi:MAG: hypothetical protein JWM28_1583 [Chitinophagaceae bacterium]|nr:hypothetical protein [Chitinophagaceae bacterium]